MNALVVYYSRTGTTKKVGEKLASLLKCMSEEIHDTKNRKGILGWLSAGKDATSKKLAKLEKVNIDPASYDNVIIGTPILEPHVVNAYQNLFNTIQRQLQEGGFLLHLPVH